LDDDFQVALKVAKEKSLGSQLLSTIQYSRSNGGGGGYRLLNHLGFFGKPNAEWEEVSSEDEIPMLFSIRQCAGVKVCEFFEVTPHTEVDCDELDWATNLAIQERNSKNSCYDRVLTDFQVNKDEICGRYITGSNKTCGGKTVIRSFQPEEGRKTVSGRLFVGCEYWQYREKGHTFQKLDGFDHIDALRVWGRERCHVHTEDILKALKFSWDDVTASTIY